MVGTKKAKKQGTMPLSPKNQDWLHLQSELVIELALNFIAEKGGCDILLSRTQSNIYKIYWTCSSVHVLVKFSQEHKDFEKNLQNKIKYTQL